MTYPFARPANRLADRQLSQANEALDDLRTAWLKETVPAKRKELLDAFRDRRMLLVAFVVIPLAIPLVLAGTNALSARKQTRQLEGPLELPVIGAERAPNLVAWLGTHDVRVVAAPDDPEMDFHEAEARMLLGDREAVLRRQRQHEVVTVIGVHPPMIGKTPPERGFRGVNTEPFYTSWRAVLSSSSNSAAGVRSPNSSR